jgi:hypothetical protein
MAFIGRLDNVATAALDIAKNGAAGLWKKLAVNGISAATAYYGVKVLTQYPPADSRFRLIGWDAGDTAKAVLVGLSLYSIVNGIMTKAAEKADPDAESRKEFITGLTTAIVLSLAANSLLKIKLNPLYATGISASLYAIGCMFDKAKTA